MTDLRSSIAAAGHTRRQAAATMGVSLSTVEAWLSGRNPMPPAMLAYYRHVAGLERLPFRES